MAIKEGTHIRTDKDTLAKLRVIADGVPVTTWLRGVANGEIKAPVPPEQLEVLRASLLKQIDGINDKLIAVALVLESLDTRLKTVLSGLVNEQNNNDILFNVLERYIPELKDVRRQIDASYPVIEEWRKDYEGEGDNEDEAYHED